MLARTFGLMLPAVFFTAALAASEPEPNDPVNADAVAEEAEATEARSEADEQVQALSGHERMRQEIEEMAESLRAGEEVDHQALRERLGVRQSDRGRGAGWWKSGEMAERLELTEQQSERLDQLHETAQTSQRQASQRQRELQQALNAALTGVDIDQATAVMAERAENAADRQRAEDAWLAGVLEVLSEDQLQLLQTEYPRMLRSRATQGRPFRER